MSHAEFVYGIHAVNALLRTQPERILRLLVQQGRQDQRLQEVISLAEKQGIALQRLSPQKLANYSEQAQGVVAECRAMRAYTEADLDTLLDNLHEPALLLLLDGVQDPHNLGACLRSANAAGVHAVIAPKDHSASLTPVVRKVACGAAEITPFIQVTNLSRTMRMLQERGIWIMGAAGEAPNSLYQTDLTGPLAIALGAEEKGLRRLTREHCDNLLHIPMQGTVESLNVSVATGICLFEALRQRSKA